MKIKIQNLSGIQHQELIQPQSVEDLGVLKDFYEDLFRKAEISPIYHKEFLSQMTIIKTREFIVVIEDNSERHHGDIAVVCFTKDGRLLNKFVLYHVPEGIDPAECPDRCFDGTLIIKDR